MKQGCVLAPTLFNIFFSVLLKHAFRSTDEDIQLRTRSERKLFNSVSLQVKTKVCKAMLHDFLFAVDAAFAAHKLLSILCLQREHLTLRHWIPDNLCWAWETLAHLLHEMPLLHPVHFMDVQISSPPCNIKKAGIPSMYTLLRQRRLMWSGGVHRMEDGRIPKGLLFGELELHSRPDGRPKLLFRDLWKKDILMTDLLAYNWELLAEKMENHVQSGTSSRGEKAESKEKDGRIRIHLWRPCLLFTYWIS